MEDASLLPGGLLHLQARHAGVERRPRCGSNSRGWHARKTQNRRSENIVGMRFLYMLRTRTLEHPATRRCAASQFHAWKLYDTSTGAHGKQIALRGLQACYNKGRGNGVERYYCCATLTAVPVDKSPNFSIDVGRTLYPTNRPATTTTIPPFPFLALSHFQRVPQLHRKPVAATGTSPVCPNHQLSTTSLPS